MASENAAYTHRERALIDLAAAAYRDETGNTAGREAGWADMFIQAGDGPLYERHLVLGLRFVDDDKLRSLNTTYFGMPVLDYVKEAQHCGFEVLGRFVQPGRDPIMLGRPQDAAVIIAEAAEGRLVRANHIAWLVDGKGAAGFHQGDAARGLSLRMKLEGPRIGRSPGFWCRKHDLIPGWGDGQATLGLLTTEESWAYFRGHDVDDAPELAALKDLTESERRDVGLELAKSRAASLSVEWQARLDVNGTRDIDEVMKLGLSVKRDI